MTSNELRTKYLNFFKSKGHAIIPSAPLVPENDPTTLFISAGMQPLVPYLLGQTHPLGNRLADCQKCIRTGDIDSVGDTFHHTFFEMLGNWSLGDYFKKESIKWSYEFLSQSLGVDMNSVWVTVFAGDEDAPRDEEAAQIWQEVGIPTERITFLGKEDNWWAAGQTGPCGPDTEIFYDTRLNNDPNDLPGSSTGRFIEIWNNVFMVYNRKEDGSLEELPKKNVDTGMGLERTLTTLNGITDNYQTDLFKPIIEYLSQELGVTYGQNSNVDKDLRVVSDHIKASCFLLAEGIRPSNKLQGYVLRRLLRRAAAKTFQTNKEFGRSGFKPLVGVVANIYPDYFKNFDLEKIGEEISIEIGKFRATLERGLKEVQKLQTIDGKTAFDLYQTYGFPLELTLELAREKGHEVDKKQFHEEFEKHKETSRTASSGMFKGGLADQGEETTKLHTATHLLHQSLRQILGTHVQQKGSNITSERLRFDFSHPQKMTNEEIKQVEQLINQKIKEALPITQQILDKKEALESGALHFFGEKYGDKVSVYFIGNSLDSAFSKEFCGGPHVKNTSGIGQVKITKEESASSGIRRIYASIR